MGSVSHPSRRDARPEWRSLQGHGLHALCTLQREPHVPAPRWGLCAPCPHTRQRQTLWGLPSLRSGPRTSFCPLSSSFTHRGLEVSDTPVPWPRRPDTSTSMLTHHFCPKVSPVTHSSPLQFNDHLTTCLCLVRPLDSELRVCRVRTCPSRR